MQFLKLKMIDPSEYKIAGVVMLFGFIAQQATAIWLAISWSLQTVIQGMITIALGLAAVAAQHFFRRWLKRNWPEDAKDEQVEPAQTLKAVAAAGVDWFKLLRPVARPLFDLIRNAISRLRRRKEP
jgi:Zn-dependent membrane protease YugP